MRTRTDYTDSDSFRNQAVGSDSSLFADNSLDTKEKVLSCYKGYIAKLSNGIDCIQSISSKNKKFERIRQECLGRIRHLLEDSQIQREDVINGTVWDRLVIAFFGETNAGKSTIIETFRIKYGDPSRLVAIQDNGGKGVDGLIVGDGRQDFTQVYEKYNLEIDGRPFVLIDVPGIEGKEANYLSEISSALKQAHCIFYVQGHNKKPDAATAEKIKGFLSDWVDVYSIYNVRGGVRNYDEEEERETLLTQETNKTQESIKEVFQKVLPGVYKGNVTCQGYLALMSVADFHESRQKLITDQAKIISFFGGRDTIESFSRFKDLSALVQSKSCDFSTHIIEANRQKLHSLSSRIYAGIDEVITNQTEDIDKLISQLRGFKSSVISIRTSVISKFDSQLNSELIQVFAALKSAANDIIDDAISEEEWYDRLTSRISWIVSDFEEEIEKLYSESYIEFRNKIDHKRKDLDRILYRRIKIPKTSIDINIDLTDVINALKLDIKEDLIKGFFKAFFTPITSLIHVFTKRDDGRDKAKRLIATKLENAKPSARNQVMKEAQKVKDHLFAEARSINTDIDEEIRNIEELKTDLKNLQNTFKE